MLIETHVARNAERFVGSWKAHQASCDPSRKTGVGGITKQVWSIYRCVLSTFFSTFKMDRRTDQQALSYRDAFYISVMLLEISDEMHEEKPSFF